MATDLRLESSSRSLAERIIETYEDCGPIHHLGHPTLPSGHEVAGILADLRELLYPGYGRRQDLHPGNLASHVGDLIEVLNDRLTEQVARALRHDRGFPDLRTDPEAKAREIAGRLLESIPELRTTLAEDVQAAYDGDPAAKGFDEIILCYPGMAAIIVFRIAHLLDELGVPLIPRMMTEYAHSKTGIDIHPGATIGRRFFIDHGTGVVIGETTRIGDNVKLYQGVTLGALSLPSDAHGNLVRGKKRHPTIEDHVVVYANATILGGRTVIGHHAVIGASTWITRSVDPYTTITSEGPWQRSRGPSVDTVAPSASWRASCG
jgi:serine O-acetyltransferase